MKKIAKIIIALTLPVIFFACSSTKQSIPDFYPDEPIIKLEPETKKPDWLKNSRVFWYDEKEKGFFVIGFSKSTDPDIALASSKANAAKNIAEYIQSAISSKFQLLKVGEGENIQNLSKLNIEMISEDVRLSIVTVETYQEIYKELGRLTYAVYTKNFVGENSIKIAVDRAIRKLDSQNERKNEIIQELKKNN